MKFSNKSNLTRKFLYRHPWLCPIVEAEDAARVIVDGVLRNEKILFVPPFLMYIWRLIGYV